MAFPVVAGFNTSVKTSSSTNHVVSLPASISAGDLLIVLFVENNAATFTWPAGWTQLIADTADGAVEVKLGVRWRIADGSEGSTITITDNFGLKSAHISIRVTGHHATTPIASGAAVASGDTGSPNPPNCNAGTTRDHLWIEGFGADDDDDDATYASTNYTGIAQVQSDSSTTSVLAAMAYRELNASAENPGVMDMAATEQWVAFTFAIRPAEATDAEATPGVISLAEDIPAPTATGAAAIEAGVQTVTESIPAQSATGAASVTPSTQTIIETIESPTPTGAAATTPGVVDLHLDVPSQTATGDGGDAEAEAGVQEFTATVPTPSAAGGGTASPGVQALAVDTPAPGVTGAANVTAAAQQLSEDIAAPGVSGGATVTPETPELNLDVPTPNGTGAVNVTPEAQSLDLDAPTPGAAGSAQTSVPVQEFNLESPAPSVTGGGGVTPSSHNLSLSTPTPGLTGEATVTPDTQSLNLEVPTVTAQAPAIANTPSIVANTRSRNLERGCRERIGLTGRTRVRSLTRSSRGHSITIRTCGRSQAIATDL